MEADLLKGVISHGFFRECAETLDLRATKICRKHLNRKLRRRIFFLY